jgi:hypothetical protein
MSADETRFTAGGRARDTRLYAGEPPASVTAPGDRPSLVRPAAGRARSLLAGLAMALAVTAGYAAGTLLTSDLAPLVFLSCLAGMALAVGGVFVPQSGRCRLTAALAALGLCLYLFVSDRVGIIAFAGDAPSVLVPIAWLSPVVLGGAVLPRRGAWLAGAGCWLALFAGSFALAYNVTQLHRGVGFFFRWVF